MPELVLAARVRDALASASATLAEAGCDTPRLDAELLLAEALGVGRERLVLEARSPVDAGDLERFHALVARRAAREPVAYILGRKAFRWITLAVDRRVLIPRPETELLVEVGLTLPAGAAVVDVGTGSGAVALALKHERPDLSVWGVDVDAGALALARENARRLGLASENARRLGLASENARRPGLARENARRLGLAHENAATPHPPVHFAYTNLLAGIDEPFYAILTNLPYVPDGTPLPPEVARYEPAEALFGGADGLDVIRRLLRMVGDSGPRPGTGGRPRPHESAGVRLVALEVGAGQASEVARLVREAGFDTVERLRDLAGHERVVVGRR